MENQSTRNRRRIKRIALDLDGVSRLKLLTSYFNAKHFFPSATIEVYETGRGNHLRIHQNGLSPRDNIAVRRHLGDEQRRIMFDEGRLRAKKVWVLQENVWRMETDDGLVDWVDTAFEHKFRRGKWTREEPCNVLSEAFITRLPARKSI